MCQAARSVHVTATQSCCTRTVGNSQDGWCMTVPLSGPGHIANDSKYQQSNNPMGKSTSAPNGRRLTCTQDANLCVLTPTATTAPGDIPRCVNPTGRPQHPASRSTADRPGLSDSTRNAPRTRRPQAPTQSSIARTELWSVCVWNTEPSR